MVTEPALSCRLLGGNSVLPLASYSAQHRLRSDLIGFGQGVLFEVGVALRHARAAVPQKLLHDIQADPAVHEVAGIAVTQVVQAQIAKL